MGFKVQNPDCQCCDSCHCSSAPSTIDIVIPSMTDYTNCGAGDDDHDVQIPGTYTLTYIPDSDPRVCFYSGSFTISSSDCLVSFSGPDTLNISLTLFNDPGTGNRYVQIALSIGNGGTAGGGAEGFSIDNLDSFSGDFVGWNENGTPIVATATSSVSTWIDDADCTANLQLTLTDRLAFYKFDGFSTTYHGVWSVGAVFEINP